MAAFHGHVMFDHEARYTCNLSELIAEPLDENANLSLSSQMLYSDESIIPEKPTATNHIIAIIVMPLYIYAYV